MIVFKEFQLHLGNVVMQADYEKLKIQNIWIQEVRHINIYMEMGADLDKS